MARPDIMAGRSMLLPLMASNPATVARTATSRVMSRLLLMGPVGVIETTGTTTISTTAAVDPLTTHLRARDKFRRRWLCNRALRCRQRRWPRRRQPGHRRLRVGGVEWKNSVSGLPGSGNQKLGPHRSPPT